MDVLRNIKIRRNTPSSPKPSTPNSKNGHARKVVKDLTHAPSVDVFQNHWRQALTVIRRPVTAEGTRVLTFDDVTLVMQNVEKMSDILVVEEEENGQQGLCLVYLLAEDILEQLVTWCIRSGVYENKIKYELLKMLENLISQSLQPLLYHKPVIKPLLCLLGSCVDTGLVEIENNVILLLHQLCVCISRNPQVRLKDKIKSATSMKESTYLELFFNVSYSSGQNNFLIFCLLIPYIHREGTLGQQARDALLLIMAASARNQVIGKYIANNSDFCPVLATGLSALYSSLPHKVRPEGHEDWYRIEKEHYLDMPDVQMIINCLEFCNAVVQVAHVLVGQQLIDYIYNGFLLPVMAPALLQSAIEEQVSAIAYLELFVRTITEPSLLRAFLHFILTTKHDDVVILDWLIDRISSSTKLCMVSLSLFKTLVELNCEDIMFALCFKHLYRLSHVMQSQKRAIKQVDIYGNIANKLLDLEPACCGVSLNEEQQRLLVSYNDGFYSGSEFDLLSNLPFNFGFGNNRSGLLSIFSSGHTPTHTRIEDYKSSYNDYLADAREMIDRCKASCIEWCFIYDGEMPPHNAALEPAGHKRVQQSNSLSSAANKYDTPDPSLEDDVPLLLLETSTSADSAHSHTADSPYLLPQTAQDSLLIDISTDTQPAALYESHVDDTSAVSGADDVPLCLTTDDVDTQAPLIDIAEPKATDDEPLVSLGDAQQNLTLNILLQSQNTVLSSSPPACLSPPPSVASTDIPPLCPPQTDAPFSSSPKKSGSIEHLDSFLSYLDDSVDHVTFDPEKSEQMLLQEIDSAISQAEVAVQKRKESQASISRTQSLSIFETADGVAALQSHPVDVGSQEETTPDSKRGGKKPASYSLRLEDMGDNSPNIGPFMATLLSKLENMMNNSLAVNLLLTGLVTRLASYPQPLLRSFLLNNSVVFQPSIKSLIQVLASVRNKVDKFAEKVPNFNVLLLQARKIMIDKVDTLDVEGDGAEAKSHIAHVGDTDSTRSPGRRITDFFKRDKHTKQPVQPELVIETNGYRFTNVKQPEKVKFESPEARLNTMNTKKAVYCALILEEFVKELAALSQEHAIQSDEGYHTE